MTTEDNVNRLAHIVQHMLMLQMQENGRADEIRTERVSDLTAIIEDTGGWLPGCEPLSASPESDKA
jgi:hypothetical protein